MKNDVKNEAMTQEDAVSVPAKPSEFNQKIGSTTYVVAVYSSRTSAETFEDKLMRLIESEVRDSA